MHRCYMTERGMSLFEVLFSELLTKKGLVVPVDVISVYSK